MEEVTEEGLVPGPLVLGEWGKHLIIYSGVCACVKGCDVGRGQWELGACGAAFHVGAEPRGPEAELGPVGRSAITQSHPMLLSPTMTTAAHGGPRGGGGTSGLFSAKNLFPRGSS